MRPSIEEVLAIVSSKFKEPGQKELYSWSVADVCSWVSQLDYSKIFEENAIDGVALQEMSEENFHTLGIRMGDLMRIKIEEVKRRAKYG
jgi:hypothetical protein